MGIKISLGIELNILPIILVAFLVVYRHLEDIKRHEMIQKDHQLKLDLRSLAFSIFLWLFVSFYLYKIMSESARRPDARRNRFPFRKVSSEATQLVLQFRWMLGQIFPHPGEPRGGRFSDVMTGYSPLRSRFRILRG